MKITIYTDGSSRGNPGPGGWGAILITDTEVLELGGYEDHTTNNRMELMAAIKALQVISSQFVGGSQTESDTDSLQTTNYNLQAVSIEVFTDSEYVKKGISIWIKGWMAKNWIGSAKKPVMNKDLWVELYAEEKRLKDAGVTFTWTYVKAHVGISLNERADIIATSCADSVIDKGATNLQLYRGRKEDYTYF